MTGTNGKTSVAYFAHQLLAGLGCPTSALTSFGLASPDGSSVVVDVRNDVGFLPAMIAGEAAKGAQAVVLESFAAALAIGLYSEVTVDVAICTGIESDHLDFHGTPEAYVESKMVLFDRVVKSDGMVVVPAGGPRCDEVAATASGRGIRIASVGPGGDSELIASDPAASPMPSTEAVWKVDGVDLGQVTLPLVDRVAVTNAMLAATAVLAIGADPGRLVEAMAQLRPPAGRLEPVGHFDGIDVVVDTAHNPGALRVALGACRDRRPARIIVVFGAGGQRDVQKRPEMGQVAAELADVVVLTDDNPRNEHPAKIRAAVRAGCPSAIEIPNRVDAIHAALRMARSGDIVLLAGRGNETDQEIGDTTFSVDDRAVARSLIAVVHPPNLG